MPNLPILRSLDEKPVKNVYKPRRIVLKSVRDRSKREYLPPKTHLGTAIRSDSPREVAELALKYLEELISEAEGLCKP